ncbi:MAG TPA: hypothetical protein DEP47_09715, partial [Chloroflexi bacterium]|nr:hypothetical protein [Chloroflexota bacterium]
MEEDRKFLERFGGYLALVVVAVLLYVGVKIVPFGRLFEFETAGETESLALSGQLEGRFVTSTSEESPFETQIDLSGVPVLINNSLSPQLNPHTFEGKKPQHSFITYTVVPNDTPIGIAEEFGIKPETLLGGNAFLSEEASALQPGQVLIILPIDGVLHDVRSGDTLEGLAAQYGVPIEDIIAYEPNNLEFPYRLYPETQVMIPGGVRDVWFWTAPQLPSRSGTSDSTGSGIAPQVQGTGTF